MSTENKLWCDLKTDIERLEFIKSGRAHETGILAKAMEKDIISLLAFRIAYKKPQ